MRPGTDAALMLAVLFVMLTEDLVDRQFIVAHSVGFEKLATYVLGREARRAPHGGRRACAESPPAKSRASRAPTLPRSRPCSCPASRSNGSLLARNRSA